ncbi:MAG: hypothetical protein JO359_12620 [Candidatus Eremiobacteraeota bacterium]|nr:hypothetical protein [Candidatus Eremiobacteraeota bacterium]
MKRAIFYVAAIAAFCGLVGCNGSSTPAPVQTPTPSPAPGPLTVSPSSLTFLGTGAGLAQTVVVSEQSYSGTFSTSSTTCTNVATIAAGPSSGAFVVTPVGAGACSFTISNSAGTSATLGVSVTVTAGGGV